ncbi:uncharacterized protein [Lolium perenne]|uniref:uncharacterized protein n=1 Tax=Lolium perenne TaxID=4522 RepID=UPI003A98F78E
MLDHLSLHCIYAQEFWADLVSRLGLRNITPSQNVGINDWWLLAPSRVAKPQSKQLNSLVMLALRALWLERNDRVFNGKRSPVLVMLDAVLDEWASWVVCRSGTLGEVD